MKCFQENSHCVKSILMRNFSGPYFLVFGLNFWTYSFCIQSRFGKIRTRKIPYTDTFQVVTPPGSKSFIQKVIPEFPFQGITTRIGNCWKISNSEWRKRSLRMIYKDFLMFYILTIMILNPLQPGAAFLYPLKTSENF